MSNPLEFSRRDLLARLAAGVSIVAAADAQHVHETMAQEKTAQKGPYKPKALTAHEYATLQRLSDLIIPADEHSPGALAAGRGRLHRLPLRRAATRCGTSTPAASSGSTRR